MEGKTSSQGSISKLNLLLTSSGLIFFTVGSYMSLASSTVLVHPGQYFLLTGIVLSCSGMISIFRRPDF